MAMPSSTAQKEELSMTCVQPEMHAARFSVSVLQMVLVTEVTSL